MNALASARKNTGGGQDDLFFADPLLPFAEGRYSQGSTHLYKPHMHRSFSVGAVTMGEIRYQVQDAKYRLRPGSLALINPDVLHACNPGNTGPRSYCMLYLQTGWCGRLQQSLWQVDQFVPVQLALLDDSSLYRNYINTMEILAAPHPLLEKEQLLIDLLTAIFLRACTSREPALQEPLHIELLKKRLAENLAEDLSLDQLAAEFSVNPCSLIRRFKAASGLSPHAFRMNCRIHSARQLLQQGRDICETALECGFFDQSHFHRYFKAITTVTPGEYRNNFIRQQPPA